MTEPPPARSRAPSAPELWDAITESHRMGSDPPAARWLDRRIGRAIRVTLRWLYHTRRGTWTFGGLAVALWELAKHVPAWLGQWMHAMGLR